MSDNLLDTEFLSAEKADLEELKRQHEYFNSMEMVRVFMNSMPTSVLVLNEQRQVICANRYFLDSVGVSDIDEIIGSRIGELFKCDHESQSINGCGTTKFCTVCGTAQAIYQSLNNKSSIKECRITRIDADALDYQVWTNPLQIGDERYIIYAIIDKSDEKRRAALERIFFHDILNTAGGIRGFIELMEDSNAEEVKEFIHISYELAERLIEEIESQRELLQAENNELKINLKHFSTFDMLKEIRTLYLSHYVAKNRKIHLDENCFDGVIKSDKAMMRRVLGNMIKNALEAVPEGETVTISCIQENDNIVFSVHNHTFISEINQLQVFKRSFSTKGAGRGLGTYSIRLLSERYLGGKVSFISEKDKGTTFFASYPKELKN